MKFLLHQRKQKNLRGSYIEVLELQQMSFRKRSANYAPYKYN
jgi:hypothetical protein